MTFDCLAGNGRSRIVLGLLHPLMEPSVVGTSVGRFILATYFLKSAPIGFVDLVHEALRQNAVREQCNNYPELLYPSVNTRYVPSSFAVARTWPSQPIEITCSRKSCNERTGVFRFDYDAASRSKRSRARMERPRSVYWNSRLVLSKWSFA